MSNEEIMAILKMSEQEKWRKGITQEQEKEAFDRVTKALANQVPEGEWLTAGVGAFKCSICGREIATSISEKKPAKEYPYCHCGAKMINR